MLVHFLRPIFSLPLLSTPAITESGGRHLQDGSPLRCEPTFPGPVSARSWQAHGRDWISLLTCSLESGNKGWIHFLVSWGCSNKSYSRAGRLTSTEKFWSGDGVQARKLPTTSHPCPQQLPTCFWLSQLWFHLTLVTCQVIKACFQLSKMTLVSQQTSLF